MNNIPMNAPMALATQQGIKTHTRREAKGLTAIATKQIGQDASEDSPAFLLAQKGEKILVNEILDESHWGYKHGFRYNCQDINKRYDGFYAKEDEVILNTPYKIGQVLWVREPARVIGVNDYQDVIYCKYLSDGEEVTVPYLDRWLNDDGLTVPKWAENCQGIPNGCIREMARTFIRVTNIRVERLNEISEGDAEREGIKYVGGVRIGDSEDCFEVMFYHGDLIEGEYGYENELFEYASDAFASLWESISGEDSFNNRWVWVIEFELISKEEAV